jgi:N6-adenosine-specific RNA methylase IME4
MFSIGPQSWPFGDLEPQAYSLIMCDPPWLFRNYSDLGDEKGPAPHYDMMTDEEIFALPVGDLARDNCMLWLWATWPKLDTAMSAIQVWGFEYKTGGSWDKLKWGTGYIWRSRCEPVLIATRGSPLIKGSDIANLFAERSREHSRKPQCAYEIAERMMPNARRVSLFERPVRPGWEAWGNQLGKAPGRQRPKRVKVDPPLLTIMEV